MKFIKFIAGFVTFFKIKYYRMKLKDLLKQLSDMNRLMRKAGYTRQMRKEYWKQVTKLVSKT